MSTALICARGGSKGLINKNILHLAGKPLLAYSIDEALKCSDIERVIVSTDSETIAELAINLGAQVPELRPESLATDQTPEWLVWKYVVNNYLTEIEKKNPLVVLPPTGPLRKSADVLGAINTFKQSKCDVVITMTRAYRNPCFNLVTKDANGQIKPAIERSTSVFRRQDAPDFYDLTTNCYVANPDAILQSESMFECRVIGYEVEPETAVDIDTQIDLEWAEHLITKEANR